jgi:acyl-CoA synthetase (AMP-forming)/AMP-acid ligase II
MQFNLADIFESLADAFPDRLAVVSGDERSTYAELDEAATRLAHHWQSLGIGRGDHVGLYLYNSRAYLEAMLAAWKLRAATININFRYVADELRYLVEAAHLKAILSEPELRGHVDTIEADRRDAGLPTLIRMETGADYARALAAASPTRDFGPRSQDDRFVLFTGGTTGMPQGVEWRHEDLFFAALQGGQPGGEPFERAEDMAPALASYGDGIHIHTAAPLIHGSSQLACWIAMMNGGVAVIAPGPRFRPEVSLDLCAREKVHTFNLVGDAMAIPVVDALEANPDRWDLSELSVLSSAGAVLSAHVRRRLEELLPNTMVLNNFGASETGHQGSAFYEGDRPIWVMDERHTTVLNDDLLPITPGSGEVGRIARFGHIPLGYYNNPEKTARTFPSRDGIRYVVPGDMATVAADGTIVFLGRGSVCINTGGEKVYAEEVEEALKQHEAVYDAVVVGVPDPRWGERVEAVVSLREGRALDAAALDAHCRSRLAGYKTPRRFHAVDAVARQPSGKPDYRWARETASGAA